jgi:tetratricopeptide (TPR) repeat protein
MVAGSWRLFPRAARRVLISFVGFFVAVSLWQAATPPPVEAAQTDLSFISSSTWTADPAAARVHVLAIVTATSHTVDVGGRRYYYDRIQLTLPPSSAAVSATSADGQKLPVTVESATSSSVIVVVELGQRLYSGQSCSVDVKFDLVDNGGSTDRDLRIGNTLMSFPVSAFGSPNTPGSSVTVLFPPTFTVQEEFGGLTRSVFGSGEIVFSSGILDDATALSAWFTATEPVPASDFRVRYVTIGALNVSLRYWADDVGWADQVELVLREGYPLLRDMIGLGDPTDTTLTVEEASTQEIGGFSGAYNQTTGQVQVSYFADPFVILHETAHLWFNSDLVTDRWVQEGFASYYAQQVVDKLGFTDHAPVLTDRLLQAAVPLNDWVSAGEPSSATDAYLYGATLEVAREIAAQAGQDGLRSVWVAARSGEAAYQPLHGSGIETFGGGATDWRRLLDLLEQATGRSYATIWRQWVMDPSQTSLLQQRDTTLAEYSSAQKAAGSWDLPPEIRRSLDTWQYDQATTQMDQARSILAERDQIAVKAAAEQTTPPSTLQNAFERLGLADADAEATNELAVLSEISAAQQAETYSEGAARAVGLLGADPQADLTAAREAFANGDMERAMSLATSARAAWQSADTAGQIRILGFSSLLAGWVLLLALFIWTRGDRSWRRFGGARASAASVAGSTGGLAAAAWPAKRGGRSMGGGRTPKRMEATHAAAADAATTAGQDMSGGAAENDQGNAPGGDVPSSQASSTADASADTDAAAAAVESVAGPEESAYELLQRGTALLHDRHNAQAAVVLERAARLERSKGSILEALGRAYFNSGQHARAAETFTALLEIDPSAHYGHFALGLCLARLGRAREARTHLRLAVALDPTSETYRRALDKIETTQA